MLNFTMMNYNYNNLIKGAVKWHTSTDGRIKLIKGFVSTITKRNPGR